MPRLAKISFRSLSVSTSLQLPAAGRKASRSSSVTACRSPSGTTCAMSVSPTRRMHGSPVSCTRAASLANSGLPLTSTDFRSLTIKIPLARLYQRRLVLCSTEPPRDPLDDPPPPARRPQLLNASDTGSEEPPNPGRNYLPSFLPSNAQNGRRTVTGGCQGTVRNGDKSKETDRGTW